MLFAGIPGELAADGANIERNDAVEVFGLKKVFPGGLNCCCKRSPDFWAIKGSWFSIHQGELFCLLGPNGAGKSTTINALTGELTGVFGGLQRVWGLEAGQAGEAGA